MARRVVITGIGLVTPLGCGTGNQIFSHVLAGRCGIRPLQDIELPALCNITMAGQVPKGSGNEEYNDALHKNRMETSLFIRYALTASQLALEDAGLVIASKYDLTRAGTAIGNGGIGSIADISNTCSQLQASFKKVSPYFVPKILTNMAAGQVSVRHGLQGPLHSVGTACAAGLHSIGDAYHFIKWDMADMMLAGGADACVDPLAIAGFHRMKALSTPTDDQIASRPFDTARNGFVMAEGSGVLVLEERSAALARGAPVIAEIVGYGLSGDAFHATSPSPEGTGAMLSMKGALRMAGLAMEQMDYVNAHATSTPMGDAVEVRAVTSMLGDASNRPYMSSTKGHTGHLLGAAGAVELAFTALAMKRNTLPATLNLQNLDPACASDAVQHIMHEPVDFQAKHGRDVQYVLKNSFGFGGTNSSIVLKRA